MHLKQPVEIVHILVHPVAALCSALVHIVRVRGVLRHLRAVKHRIFYCDLILIDDYRVPVVGQIDLHTILINERLQYLLQVSHAYTDTTYAKQPPCIILDSRVDKDRPLIVMRLVSIHIEIDHLPRRYECRIPHVMRIQSGIYHLVESVLCIIPVVLF